MQWEFIGAQKLHAGKGIMGGRGSVEMWRTPVPGGWLLIMGAGMAGGGVNPAFYPDPQHVWNPLEEAEDVSSQQLLRPAGEAAPGSLSLLPSLDEPEE